MDNVFIEYSDTYIRLLPKELKDMLRSYVYGKFIIRLIYNPNGNQLMMKVYATITEKSYTWARIPMELFNLRRYSKIKLPMNLTDDSYILKSDNRLAFEIRNDNSITIGEGPQIIFGGQDFYAFMAKLKQMYNDIDNEILKSDHIYYY